MSWCLHEYHEGQDAKHFLICITILNHDDDDERIIVSLYYGPACDRIVDNEFRSKRTTTEKMGLTGTAYTKRTKSKPNTNTRRIVMKTHLHFFHMMNLNDFHGDVIHKNDVSGRLKQDKEHIITNQNTQSFHSTIIVHSNGLLCSERHYRISSVPETFTS